MAKLVHSMIRVIDEARSVDFYRRAFGLEIVDRLPNRAALEACVGGAFFPGIEAGGLSAGSRPILESTYAAPFRLG